MIFSIDDDYIGVGALLEEAEVLISIVGHHKNIVRLKGIVVEGDANHVSEVIFEWYTPGNHIYYI